MQNGTISELYTVYKKSKYSTNHNHILKWAKTLMKSFIKKRQKSKTAIAELSSKISNKNIILNTQFQNCKVSIFLDKVSKPINSQTNFKSSKNDHLTANFYKHLSNKLSFDLYQ